ncbi:MAG TPA: ribosome small subunit-dependent GTPase A [Anaerolineaceae bacterium]|nr:ribosome small subunit-dependent GTPase A [Anaerolineaceae bacterium]HPN52237.1 ribosome small subunit-dependent GTPase A [Anaerolineaceae bacterium]
MMSDMRTLEGLVVRLQAGFFTVQTEEGLVTCHVRGRLKKGPQWADLVAVGDRVTISIQMDGSGAIEAVTPRRAVLSRMAALPRGEYQQIMLANPDQAVFIFACANPSPHLRMLDRFLVIAEQQHLPAFIVANKVDLLGKEQAEAIFGHYPALGYPVLYTSARAGLGVDALRERLLGKISAFSGPSGVGKSSLLNAVQPGLSLAVSHVSDGTMNKGRHTTVVREMFPLEGGGYVADMPGLRSLALWDTQPEELDGYFPELRDLVMKCRFNDCTHRTEPGCAVRAAVDAGQVHPERYESYLRLRYGDE